MRTEKKMFFIVLCVMSLMMISCDNGGFFSDGSESKSLVTGQFQNPLNVNYASDPMILKDGDYYYLYSTHQDTLDTGFKVWQSSDMVNWTYQGMAFQKNSSTWSQHDFWAPEVVKDGSTYYMYYSARDDAAFSQRRICCASGSDPLGPFTEVAAPLFDDGAPANIDAHLFKDTDGNLYMYYARESWFWGAFCENQTWVVSMNNYTSAKTDYTFCIKATQSWEKISYGGLLKWNEAPWVLKNGNTYYLMYSANCYDSKYYGVGYATSSSPKGPWIKYSNNPVLSYTDEVSGPGHHGVVADNGGQMWMVYHSHMSPSGGGDRQINIDKMNWDGNNIIINGPTITLQDYPE